MKKICTLKLFPIKSGSIGRVLTCLSLLICFILAEGNAVAQASDKTVSINMTDVMLSDVLKEIRRQSGIQFIYSDNELDKAGKVTFNFTNLPVTRALNTIFSSLPFKYELDGAAYIITPSASNQPTTQRPQQPARRTITGRVLSSVGTPLVGASVIYEDAFIGVTTDTEGNFSINVPVACRELAVSYVGYDGQTVSVVDRSNITVTLVESTNVIDQVVVTGYFDREKSTFTGATTAVGREELRKFGNVNMIEALRMVDPSFKIKENNLSGSDPNTLPDFFVRGESSFMGESNIPTFIIDGYEVTLQKVFDMDLDRIESLTILKDASATILYGSRAANGVIVIETRKPEGGRFTVSYNNRTSISFPDLSDYDLLNAQEKLEFEMKANIYDLTRMDDLEHIEYIKNNVARGVDTDWMAQPLRTAVSHTHSLYLEGGNENVVYGVGANYNRNNGVMRKSHREVFGFNFDLTYRISGKISIRNSFEYSQTNVKNSPYGSFSDYTSANPYNPIHDENGKLIKNYPNHRPVDNVTESTDPQYQNPLYNATLPHKDEQSITMITNNLSFDYYILPELRFKASVALTKGLNDKDYYLSPNHSSFLVGTSLSTAEKGKYTKGQGKDFSYNVNATLAYTLTRDKHTLFAAGGLNIVENKTNYSEYTASGFVDERFNEIWFAGGFLPNARPTGVEGKDRLIGVFANVNYAYDNRYFADLSARLDGSSKFGKDSRVAPFYSAGLGWNIHNESFLKDTPWLSQLRLRGSLGMTGNQSFDPYMARTTLQYATGTTYWQAMGAYFMTYGNTDLEWQKTLKTNIGFDLEVLQRRLNLRIDYYNDKTKSLLLPVSVTPSLGFGNYTENFGEQRNEGYEFDLNVVIIRNDNIDWAVNVGGTHNTNKITKISDALRKLNDDNNNATNANTSPIAMYEEGESINAIKVVRSLGINPATGNELFVTRDGRITEEWDYRDKYVAGTTDPKLQGTFGSNLIWKNFTFNVLFTYSHGGQLYNSTLAKRIEGAEPRRNADRRVLTDRWQEPDDHTFFKNIADRQAIPSATSRFVQDNNYLELSNISLSHRFATDNLKALGISNARVGLNSNNLFYISSVKRERGLDYPFARQFTLSVNLIF